MTVISITTSKVKYVNVINNSIGTVNFVFTVICLNILIITLLDVNGVLMDKDLISKWVHVSSDRKSFLLKDNKII